MDNMEELLNKDMMDPVDPVVVEHIVSAKPFFAIEGGFNLRDLSDVNYPALMPGYAFRSGSLEELTPQGQQDLLQLGVKTVFDLRSPAEVKAYPDPNIEGIEIVLAPTNSMMKEGLHDLASMYLYMLQTSTSCFRAMLTHIRDFADRPFLFHCTAGKDRTGVVAALILGLAGLPPSYISREYALTRIGTEPVRDMLTLKMTGGKDIDIRSNPLLRMLSTSRAETIVSLLDKIDEKYGGVEGYAKLELGFSDEEIARMRTNLRGYHIWNEC